jgi:membrane protein
VHPVLIGIRSRLLALVLIVIISVLLIAVILTSVVLSAYASALEKFPGARPVDRAGDLGRRALRRGRGLLHADLQDPARRPRAVEIRLHGGAVNALLFAAGNRALVYYFEVTELTSAFGATAGSPPSWCGRTGRRSPS